MGSSEMKNMRVIRVLSNIAHQVVVRQNQERVLWVCFAPTSLARKFPVLLLWLYICEVNMDGARDLRTCFMFRTWM